MNFLIIQCKKKHNSSINYKNKPNFYSISNSNHFCHILTCSNFKPNSLISLFLFLLLLLLPLLPFSLFSLFVHYQTVPTSLTIHSNCYPLHCLLICFNLLHTLELICKKSSKIIKWLNITCPFRPYPK